MYSVHQHWDPLKVCIVGKSYSPEFYTFIKNSRIRQVMERIAEETEEDFQKLIALLKSFNVDILRPDVTDNYEDYINQLDPNKKIVVPPYVPRDFSAMIGNTFYLHWDNMNNLANPKVWNYVRGASWPIDPPRDINQLDASILHEIKTMYSTMLFYNHHSQYDNIVSHIKQQNNTVVSEVNIGNINSSMISRIGRDLYFGTEKAEDVYGGRQFIEQSFRSLFTDYRCHIIDTQGHTDSTFCPVVPGLIVSLKDIPNYSDTFPGWEVIYLPNQSWDAIPTWKQLKKKNNGKWWVPGEELNDEFTDYVEQWLGHWVGYVEETVFDVNMLVIDEKNVVCTSYNKDVFDAFDRYGITPHIVNFRHRYFLDGGLHCITSDLHREGTMKDYFPERG
jgi:N-dimethylarginine dimethylaminohydrolase